MKKIAIIIGILVLAATTFAVAKDTVEGNKKVVKEERTVKDFTKVSVSDGIDLYLTQGNEEKLVLEVDENLLKYIKTEVKGNTLKIYSDKNIKKPESLKAYLTFKSLDRIKGSSGADIYAEDGIEADEMDIDMSSGSDMKIKLKANKASFDMSSGSDAIVKFDGKVLDIDASSGSDLDIKADKLDEISLDMSSGSDINLEGTATKMKLRASSGSDLNAFGFVTVNADIDVSSASDVKLTVTGNLEVDASSASTVRYKGKAKITDINASSLATVKAD
ncbi:MAG: hypothetical protein C0599_09545 [Salinivirgaceae bacterium]|nr:MAG: hypothetical protein C0599_09545 [Salinivirgaceae bacterium]